MKKCPNPRRHRLRPIAGPGFHKKELLHVDALVGRFAGAVGAVREPPLPGARAIPMPKRHAIALFHKGRPIAAERPL
jgi:hypothetical protein